MSEQPFWMVCGTSAACCLVLCMLLECFLQSLRQRLDSGASCRFGCPTAGSDYWISHGLLKLITPCAASCRPQTAGAADGENMPSRGTLKADLGLIGCVTTEMAISSPAGPADGEGHAGHSGL